MIEWTWIGLLCYVAGASFLFGAGAVDEVARSSPNWAFVIAAVVAWPVVLAYAVGVELFGGGGS